MPRVKGKATVKNKEKRVATEINQTLKLEERDEFGKPLHIRCKCCNKIKAVKDFIVCRSPENKTGYSYICKSCCSMMSLDENGNFNKQKVYDLLKIIDKPFINNIFEKVNTMMNSRKTDMISERSKIAVYLSIVNSMNGGYRNSGFINSEKIEEIKIEVETTNETKKQATDDIDLWGEGWTATEMLQLNRKFNLLLNNYPLRTEMHKEMLVKYCKYSLREELAIAQGNTNDAKYWGELAMKIATNAKINPSQLSASDLSDGMTCFGQVVSAVEKSKDIVQELPRYIERPLDRVDYTIYMMVDYIRDLEGKPHCDYKDVWNYMLSQYERNSKKFGKDVVPKEDKLSPNAILVDGE